MPGKELTKEQIAELLAGHGSRTRSKKDPTEPRTTENWWKQVHHLIYRPDHPELDIKCTNPHCGDTRPEDAAIILAEVKGALICRYCFLSGFLSDV